MSKKQVVLLIIVMLSTAFIFSNSLKTAKSSTKDSDIIVNAVSSVIEDMGFTIPPEVTKYLIIFVRKSAHIAEYVLQSFCLCCFFRTFDGGIRKHVFHIMFFGIFTGCFDEGIQLGVLGRSGEISDVFIDFGGTLFGIIFSIVLFKFIAYFKIRRSSDETK